ncbi:MAG TPA: TetR family transcriptional regulator [Bacteroidales bacterium]|jgi:AcrR family transcriptional regulator|nr:MAG: putative acrEF/envCD operon repressor [Bacteroidetes bacterium ADurb.Bin416]HBL72978.1 TetR family transcriptional regulator [Bacteroidales bacterium]
MAVSKTRTMLVEVARQLFATNGVQETTMNDIAEASGKGRRTLYTYFRNKEEVYVACIEAELQLINASLLSVMKQDLDPEEKIRTFIATHFDVFRDAVLRNGNLNSQFFRNIVEVEKARRNLDQKEAVMLAQLLREGQNQGLFHIKDIKHSASILQLSIKGLEVPYIRETVLNRKKQIQHIYDFLFYGLKGQALLVADETNESSANKGAVVDPTISH